jgi:hypothetical protein
MVEKNWVKIVEEEIENIGSEDILNEIRDMFRRTGGFRLEIDEQPLKNIEYIYLVSGSRPGPSFDYKLKSRAFTDGAAELVSFKSNYEYPTRDDCTYKYKIKNASWIIIAEKYGDDFDGDWQWKEAKVMVYGNCPFLKELQELQQELEI